MGNDIALFREDDRVYVPIQGLQGAMDLRPVGLPDILPVSVQEVFPDFKPDTWRVVVIPYLRKAFRQYSGGVGLCGVIMFDFR